MIELDILWIGPLMRKIVKLGECVHDSSRLSPAAELY